MSHKKEVKSKKSKQNVNIISDEFESIFIKNDNSDTSQSTTINNSTKTIEQKYQKKTQIEHILLRPDTYVGDISIQEEMMWIWDGKNIIQKKIKYVPGLYKIFDEIIVNARDHNIEDPSCDTIKVNINQETNTISVWNNGKGIDIIEHSEHKMYIPELLFGELLTSTNYDDTQKRTTGGRNGYGAKLTNVFSTFFSVETIDGERKLKFYQEFTNNLSDRTPAKITKLKEDKTATYTKITFKPDLAKFKLTYLTDDIVALMSKRVIDIAGISKIKVYLNDIKIDINSFKKYISLYQINNNNDNDYNDNTNNLESDDDLLESNTELKVPKEIVLYEEIDRWKLGILYIPDGNFEQISFVNSICTYHGGNHVDYVINQIIKKLEVIIQKKYKDFKVKPASIKENLIIFLDSVIENPAFTSQTKETLKTKISDFGSTFEPSDKLIKRLSSTGIVDQIIHMAQLKEELFLKKTDGKKTTSVRGIPKLEDAEFAGSKKSSLCKLILTEGDSAKALAMAGRSIIGSEYYGVFPLKGKLLNVRDASPKQLLENEEIINIKKILGLQHNKEYTDINDLRYGGIVLMCDQDYDGFHIKGLLMNFFHYFWPSLLQYHNFISALATPIVKATKRSGKNTDSKVFYNLTDYSKWKELSESKNYTIKYYKGLGTSTKEEAKGYFEDFKNKLIYYTWKPGNYLEPETNDLPVNVSHILDIVNTVDKIETKEIEEIQEIEEIGNTSKSKVNKKTNNDLIIYENSTTENSRDLLYVKVDKNQQKIFGVYSKYIDECTEAITLGFEKNRANCRKTWLRNYNKNRILSNDQKNVPIPDFIHKELIHFSNDDINRSIPSLVDGLKPSTRKILYGAILRKLDLPKDEIKVSQLSGFVSDKTCYHHGEASLNGAIVGMAQNFVGSNNINILYPSGQFGTRLVGGKDAASPRYTFTYLAELTRLIFRPEDDPILDYIDDDGILVEPEWFCPIIPMVLVNGAEGIGTGFSTKITQFNPLDIVENLKILMNKSNNKILNQMNPYFRNFNGNVEYIKPNEYMVNGIYQKISDDTIKITELPVGIWTTSYNEFIEKKCEKIKSIQPLIQSYKKAYTDESIDFTLKIDEYTLEKLENNGQLMSKLRLSTPLKLSNMHLYDNKSKINKYENVLDILTKFYEVRLQMYTKRKEYIINKLQKELNILSYKKKFIEDVLNGIIIIYKQKKLIIINRLIELKYPQLANSSDIESYNYITDIPLFNLTEEKIEELESKYNTKEEELRIVKITTEIDKWSDELDEFTEAYKKWTIIHSNLDKKNKKTKSKQNK
jgi:DNA topoisomerase-2